MSLLYFETYVQKSSKEGILISESHLWHLIYYSSVNYILYLQQASFIPVSWSAFYGLWGLFTVFPGPSPELRCLHAGLEVPC